MKSAFALFAAAAVLANVASAVVRPGWERPLMKATLSQVDGEASYPRARTLTINKQDGAKEPTSFTLVEDTGIRCVTTPCPSTATTMFRIQKVSSSFHHSDVVRYEAFEVLRNIPPHVRIAPRRLNVTESSMELVRPGGGGFMRRTYWEVEIVTFPGKTKLYQGQPQVQYTPAGAHN